jgi:hypothetical protein
MILVSFVLSNCCCCSALLGGGNSFEDSLFFSFYSKGKENKGEGEKGLIVIYLIYVRLSRLGCPSIHLLLPYLYSLSSSSPAAASVCFSSFNCVCVYVRVFARAHQQCITMY